MRAGGYWGMACWNGLSEKQQERLITVGNLPLGYATDGPCQRPAECEIETMYDQSPGPRFYCLACATEYLEALRRGRQERPALEDRAVRPKRRKKRAGNGEWGSRERKPVGKPIRVWALDNAKRTAVLLGVSVVGPVCDCGWRFR